jgi:hypothetical protein
MEIVRNSAIKGLREIETIIHVRLPLQRAPAPPKTLEGEEDEHSDDINEIPDDTMIDESMTEEAHTEPIMVPKADDVERPAVAPSIPLTTVAEVVKPSLPAFVAAAQTHNMESSKEVPPTSSIEHSKPPGVEVMRDSQTKAAASVTTTDNGNIFARGAWKDIGTTIDEEDEEIPEIDMGFDSDDE